jgi:hypothetical protein
MSMETEIRITEFLCTNPLQEHNNSWERRLPVWTISRSIKQTWLTNFEFSDRPVRMRR